MDNGNWGKYGDREKIKNYLEARAESGSALISDGKQIFENQADIYWLTTKEAANFLRISSKSLLNLTSNGRVRYYKFGRSNRFLLMDLHFLLLGQPRGGSYGN